MSNNMTERGIDIGFPVAHEDNDTQVFRDNFSAIDGHIADLQNDMTIVNDTAAWTNANNDFSKHRLENAALLNVRDMIYGHETSNDGFIHVEFAEGAYQILAITIEPTINPDHPVNWLTPDRRYVDLFGFPNDVEDGDISQDKFVAKVTLEFNNVEYFDEFQVGDGISAKTIKFRTNLNETNRPIIEHIHVNDVYIPNGDQFWTIDQDGSVSFMLPSGSTAPVIIEAYIYRTTLFLNYANPAIPNSANDITLIQSDIERLEDAIGDIPQDSTTIIGRLTVNEADILQLENDISSVDDLQIEIDAIENGAGLDNNGNYVVNGSASYINTATSLRDADDKLDGQIAINSFNIGQLDTSVNLIETAIGDIPQDSTTVIGRITVNEADILALQNAGAPVPDPNTAMRNTDNDFTGHKIENSVLTNNADGLIQHANVSGSTVIDFEDGPWQTFEVTAASTFTFTNWPNSEGLSGKIMLEIIDPHASTEITFAPGTGITEFRKNNDAIWQVQGNNLVFNTSYHGDPTLIEIWGHGGRLYFNYLGRFDWEMPA